jgi:hypothetical protein
LDSSTFQHVQGADDLGQHRGEPVQGAGHHGQQFGPLGVRGDEPQRGVRLQHVQFGPAAELPEVVHHRDVFETALISGFHDVGQGGAELFRAAGPGEVRDLNANFHDLLPPRE